MATQEQYQWRRDKDGLGVWEHRGKVAVAGYRAFAGRPALGRRLDGQDAGRLLHPGLPEGHGRRRRHAGPDRRRHLLRQPHRRWQRRFRVAMGAAALLRPALRLGVGAHAGERGVAHQADAPAQRQVCPHQRAHDQRNGRHGGPGGGRRSVHHLSGHLPDGQSGRALSPRRRERRRLRQRRPPVDGALGQSRRQRFHQHLPAQSVLPQIRRHTRRPRAVRDQPAPQRPADAVGLQRHPWRCRS